MGKLTSVALWGLIALAGAFSFGALALGRGESVNAVWLVTAALSVYFIAYRFYSKFIAGKVAQLHDARGLVTRSLSGYVIAYPFYSKFIAEKVLQLDDARVTPAYRHNDGMDYVP